MGNTLITKAMNAEALETPMNKPTLYNYKTGARVREATRKELAASKAAAQEDGGAGVIMVDGVPCYVVR